MSVEEEVQVQPPGDYCKHFEKLTNKLKIRNNQEEKKKLIDELKYTLKFLEAEMEEEDSSDEEGDEYVMDLTIKFIKYSKLIIQSLQEEQPPNETNENYSILSGICILLSKIFSDTEELVEEFREISTRTREVIPTALEVQELAANLSIT